MIGPPIVAPAGIVNVLPPLVITNPVLPAITPLRFAVHVIDVPAAEPVQLAVYKFEP
jgi:hypothetical protein